MILRRAILAGKIVGLDKVGSLDPEWFGAHAVDIITTSPSLIRQVVWMLNRYLPRAERDSVCRDIANIDSAMRAALIERINKEFDGEERARILSIVEEHG